MINTFEVGLKNVSIDSGQYLPEQYGKCHRFHGHTYFFKNFKIRTDKIIDMNFYKKIYDSFDHYIIAPECDKVFWEALQKWSTFYCEEKHIKKPCEFITILIPYTESTVEFIGLAIKQKLLEIPGVIDVMFDIYETPKAYATISWSNNK